MLNLVDELQKAYHGDAWHGNNTLNLLLNANSQKVFTHPIPNAHSIAELALHLTAWTEEVAERLSGAPANEPSRGDWPTPTETSIAAWEMIVNDFKKANEKLIELINNFIPASWAAKVTDVRDGDLASSINNAQLLNGLIQHHAYHAGQIALLCKF
jgi:uncharacterized damage-inducible protein DinB